jgi:hypothetical protein
MKNPQPSLMVHTTPEIANFKLILDFEFDQHLESHKHVISIIMGFRGTGCYMHFQFPLDYWNNEAIQNTLASFGRVILWENDRRHLARLLVRARVTNLQDVPHFILIIDGEEFHGESWMVQCEILEQHMLGGGGNLPMKSQSLSCQSMVSHRCLTSLG